ncbi:MAG: glycerol kinase GlpK [Anaerolineae bacterium]|nr:glycerol kinase GlpK [Anaerolineae bacterium]
MTTHDEVILAIDQGTTNTKVLLIDRVGQVIGRAARPLEVAYPRPAWVEQDPTALWRSVQEAIDECLQSRPQVELTAIAVTNQRESVVLWERATGQPVGPCVIWQCQRGADFCRDLAAQNLEPMLRQRTGLTIDPMFSASKMRWLLDNTPDGRRRAEAGELCLGTIDSWVLFNLSGGRLHACDMTNASRTQLFNLHTLQWDEELLALFDIPAAALPQINPSSHIYGESTATGSLPGGVPIASLIGDSHAALFGHAGFQPGAIKATYGTGSSLMTVTPAPVISRHGLSTTIAWATSNQATYALEGNIYATGAAVQWLDQLLDLNTRHQHIETLATGVPDTGGVYLVPAFVGLGAPHWQTQARGLITGLTRGTSAAHLARATLESIAYQVRDVFDVMQAEAGIDLTMLLADGGASQNNFLMQFQADILDCPVQRNLSTDVSALGAAYLAGLAIGLWPTEADIAALPRNHDRFAPDGDLDRTKLYAGWQAAVARTLFDPEA